jgi:hypothetical protein
MSDYGVLIIAYRRPRALSELIERLIPTGKSIYVYVDLDEGSSIENQEAIKIAEKFHASASIICKINLRNAGVGQAVPSAIMWSLGYEENILVLEDDCEIGTHALEYFDNSKKYISEHVMLVSGRSAWPEKSARQLHNQLTLTNFALTNGFLISRDSWRVISRTLFDQRLEMRFIMSALKRPRNLIALCYFYAACKLNSMIEMKAWDCFIVFQMLTSNLYSCNPNHSAISTRGIDEVASNTKMIEWQTDEYIVIASQTKPSEELDYSRKSLLKTNFEISKNVYKCNYRHLLSPMKAWFKILIYKFL